jgi:hypothetical protein
MKHEVVRVQSSLAPRREAQKKRMPATRLGSGRDAIRGDVSSLAVFIQTRADITSLEQAGQSYTVKGKTYQPVNTVDAAWKIWSQRHCWRFVIV